MVKSKKMYFWLLVISMSFMLALAFALTCFKEWFVVYEESNTIEIIDTAEKNEKSGGTDVRLKSVKIDGELIPFSDLEYSSDWIEMDELLIAINPQRPTSLQYTGNHIKNIEIDFQMHDGSGIVSINNNGKSIGKIDLYDPGWNEVTFEHSLGHVSIITHLGAFIALWIVLAVIVKLLHCILKIKRDKWDVYWLIFVCIDLIILFLMALKSNNATVLKVAGSLAIIIVLVGEFACYFSIFLKEKSSKFIYAIKYLLVLMIAFLLWMTLEIGCNYPSEFEFFKIAPRYIILNVLTILAIINVISCITIRWWISSLITGVVIFVISVVNYYVIQFHAMPLSVNEIRNFGTALEVIGSYQFNINRYIIYMIVFFAFVIAFIYLLKRIEKGNIFLWKRILIRDVALCFVSFAIVYKGYFAENAVKSAKNIEYAWQDTFHEYGYIACSIDLIRQAIEVIQEPEGYSDARIEELADSLETNGDEYNTSARPDIILILNETFFDLRQITDIETDQEFLSNWDSITNAIKGYAVAPLAGGGTNCSEYELLTGNSLQLMPGITPFYVLDLIDANGIASNLNELGYETLAAHSEWENSYNRKQSYPNLGFQITHFDTDFVDKEYYGNRQYYETDICLYKNLITWYNEMSADTPRFLYLLTIQNHGNWNINDSNDDIVHVKTDFGNTTDLINEYLSCIKQSDDALKYLMDYLKTVDRPVIVCMVGDHSPGFAAGIIDSNYSQVEQNIRLRGTPFMIWSNYGLESKNLGYISMNYLPSVILETAGLKLSPYYTYLQQLQQEVPIVSSYGKYYDIMLNEYDYDENTEYTEMINDYFYLEYNNLIKNIRKQELFEP